MPDNTNVNNNASVVVVGRTAPVPPGQQKSEKSVPVVIASDQSTIPVAEQNKVASEVALSLLGIPRSEVALGIFADVNTYDVNPTEWAADPEQFSAVAVGNTTPYDGIDKLQWGLSHIPEESGALLEAPPDKTAVLTSKRFFRYQPGRVSAATFGVKTTVMNPASTDANVSDTNDIGSTVYNPAIRKYGIFDNFDGYYWETRNNGQGDNFCVVRRTQSLLFDNPVEFSVSADPGQTADYGSTNPLDPLARRASEADNTQGIGQTTDTGKSIPAGFRNIKLGDLVIYRDNLMMTHAGVYDPSLLQEQKEVPITQVTGGDTLSFNASAGLGRSVYGATYDIDSGLMTITTHGAHGYPVGKYVTLGGIGMTCQYSYTGGSATPYSGGIKTYPNRVYGYNILQVGTTTSFTINVGVSTVPTFYHSGGHVLGLSTSQFVSYSAGANLTSDGTAVGIITGLTNDKIYRVNSISYNINTGITTVSLKNFQKIEANPGLTQNQVTGITNGTYGSYASPHSLVTPVPFVHPNANSLIGSEKKYGTVKPSGMFPYKYEDAEGNVEGYIDTRRPVSETATLKTEIDAVNLYYRDWINQNVKKDFWNVYEYRVPRSRFSGDRLDNATDTLLYSDVTASNRAGSNVLDETTGEIATDTSIWNLEFDKVTMYKIEFSWYGAVGALFLAYVPVSNGEARWVRIHHLRASNQLKGSSLGNATLPITYMIYGGGGKDRFGYPNARRLGAEGLQYGSKSEHIVKYGASYYIDGGDRGTVKLFSYGTDVAVDVFGSKRSAIAVGSALTVTQATSTTDPYLQTNSGTGLSSSFYVGAKVITGNAIDQNVEITYVDVTNHRLHLNVPLSSTSIPGNTIDIIANRTTPLVGLKCRDFIQSSTGQNVRNRTQVYPTRLSTGSTGMIKVDLLKSPIFQTTSTVTGSQGIGATTNIGKRGEPTFISVTTANYLAEGTGVYGYFRGSFANDPSNKKISVFGYLERRAATTGTPGYYFRAENSTNDEIKLDPNFAFLYESHSTPKGEGIDPTTTEFTLDALSSIKVNPQNRSPIPKTGTIVASLYIPASGEEFDLSPYFDYNKEYLSFPLTNVVESLYIVGSSEGVYNSGVGIATVSASVTWEEQ